MTMTFPHITFRHWLLYAVYALLAVIIFLYLLFPTKEFKTFCTQALTRHLPDYESSIESLHYQFPLTLVARNLHLQSKNKAAQELFEIEKITLTPDIKAPQKRFSVSITAYGGTHRIALTLDHAHSTFALSKIEINNLDLAKLPWLHSQTGRAITGLLSLQGKYSGPIGQDISQGTGEGSAHVKKGTFELLYPILSLKDIDIDQGEAQFQLLDQKIILTKGKFSGQNLEGTFSGQIVALNSTTAAMQLHVTGNLTPLPALIKKSGQSQPLLLQLQKNHSSLPFQLQGTIGKPIFRFDS